jgi:hypothetical protein
MTELDHIRRDIESICLRLDKIEYVTPTLYRPDSESALRRERTSETMARVFKLWNQARAALQRAMGELDAANRNVQILEKSAKSRNESIAACLRSCAQTIRENKVLHTEAVEYLLARALATSSDKPPLPNRADSKIAKRDWNDDLEDALRELTNVAEHFDCCRDDSEWIRSLNTAARAARRLLAEMEDSNPEDDLPEPAPLGEALIDQCGPADLDSNTEKPPYPYTLDATTWPVESPFQPIGVHDYPSFVSCLRANFKIIFGEDAPFTDPQDMIQRMTAEIQRLRSLYGTV